jgi:sulfur transfer protein SufE
MMWEKGERNGVSVGAELPELGEAGALTNRREVEGCRSQAVL